jgi:glycerol kinase
MTRGTDRRHFARAVVESMAYQTADVIRLMQEESGVEIKELRVDGGASVMDFLLQFQADLLRVIVRRPTIADTTALGAALLAGLATGVWEGLGQIEERWKVEKEARPREDAGRMNKLYQAWKKAVERSLGWAQEIERSGECGQACERT